MATLATINKNAKSAFNKAQHAAQNAEKLALGPAYWIDKEDSPNGRSIREALEQPGGSAIVTSSESDAVGRAIAIADKVLPPAAEKAKQRVVAARKNVLNLLLSVIELPHGYVGI